MKTKTPRVGSIKSFKVNAILSRNHLKPQDIEKIEIIHKLLKNADEWILKALDYFEKGLVLAKWPEDAFLNFYKAIELIFKKYFRQLGATEIDEIFHKPKKRVTAKEKMKYTCNKLGIPQKWLEKVDDLVDKRNKQDVAHAKLYKGDIDHNDVFNCRALAKLIIVNDLKTQQRN